MGFTVVVVVELLAVVVLVVLVVVVVDVSAANSGRFLARNAKLSASAGVLARRCWSSGTGVVVGAYVVEASSDSRRKSLTTQAIESGGSGGVSVKSSRSCVRAD